MTFLNLYIGFAFIAVLMYGVMLDYDGLRNHISDLLEELTKTFSNNGKVFHGYSLLLPLAVFVGFTSLFGILLNVALIIDYLRTK